MESHMTTESLSDPELFRKYEGGRTPPLVSPDSRLGLVNDKLLEIYQRGFSDVHDVPLGVLLAGDTPQDDHIAKWRSGNYVYNERARAGWTRLCRLIRDFTSSSTERPGDQACERCDREHARLAEEENRAVAYLCCHGLIDFAVPVRVVDRTVAVLFSGQLRPRPGEHWSTNLVRVDCQGQSAESHQPDLVTCSQQRITRLADYGISQAKIEEAIDEDEEDHFSAVGASDVRRLLKNLNTASRHLSDLATRTYELEKHRLASLVRFEFARPLTLAKETSDIGERLHTFRSGLESLASFLGLGFAALCRMTAGAQLEILCQVGLDDVLPDGAVLPPDLLRPPQTSHQPQDSVRVERLSPWRHLDAIDTLCGRYEAAGHQDPTVICATPTETAGFMLLLGRVPTSTHLELAEIDIPAVAQIASVACLVAETLCLLDDVRQSRDALRQSHEAMDKFVEDVAHDIRAPVHAIIMKAALLKRLHLQPKEYTTQASRVAAAVMRIHLVAQRVWMVQQLHRGELRYHDHTVSIRETVSKVVDTLADESERRQVDVSPEWDSFAQVPSVVVDPNVFFEVILNLVDNAIKYSTHQSERRRPQVIVKAVDLPESIVVSVGNRGIEIPVGEGKKIFERYYRTAQARRLRPDGSGIGLSIVRGFAEHYGCQIQVMSDVIRGTSDFLTRFEIHLKKER
jgi:signal transduction histidine kinase